MSMEQSNEIKGRVQEIQNIAAALPQGGDVERLKIELTRLVNWANQTLLYPGRIKNKSYNHTN